MRYILLFICVSLCSYAKAQKKIQYTGGVEGGLSMGDKPTNSFIFTTQGIAYGQYTFSAGSGIDFYPFRSVPVFVDVKRKFGNKSLQPFVQAAAGINFTSSKSKDAKYWYQYADGKFKDGLFAKVGGGLVFNAQKKVKLSLSAGYTYKTTAYKYVPYNVTPWYWQVQPVKDVYRFNRWYIGAGIMW
jgi:hypothetical protein